MRYRGLLGVRTSRSSLPESSSDAVVLQGERLILTDPAALNHVLTSHTYDYAKPDDVRGDLAMVLGKGLVFAEGMSRDDLSSYHSSERPPLAGETHRRQRRLMNSAFAPSNLKAMTVGFFEHAHQVR